MKHVQNKKQGTCGQCCVAMLTDVPYEVIERKLGDKHTYTSELRDVLNEYGLELEYVPKPSRFGTYLVTTSSSAIGRRRSGHVVIYSGGVEYDPNHPTPKVMEPDVFLASMIGRKASIYKVVPR